MEQDELRLELLSKLSQAQSLAEELEVKVRQDHSRVGSGSINPYDPTEVVVCIVYANSQECWAVPTNQAHMAKHGKNEWPLEIVAAVARDMASPSHGV